jgi:hypothetical protein
MSIADSTQDPALVQAFELRMDNPEDQEELNRRLRKPEAPAVPPNGPGLALSANPSASPAADTSPADGNGVRSFSSSDKA